MRLRRLKRAYGSHLPVLIRAMQISKGDVVECGCGVFSTPFLHWACFDAGRKLYTYEGDEKWYSFFSQSFHCDHHNVQHIVDWDSIDLSDPVGLAIIDHRPKDRRWQEAVKLLHADFVILHDAGGKDGVQYGYDKLRGLFQYTWMYRKTKPMTAVVSNKFNCKELFQ